MLRRGVRDYQCKMDIFWYFLALFKESSYLCRYKVQNDMIMEAKRTTQQVIDWLKAAEKRQQDWQQEVKKRWAEKKQPKIVAAV